MVTNWPQAYQGRKVFLTGHTGFKGTWMLQWLKLLGAEVKGYALAPEQDEALYHLLDGNTLCQSVIADIRDAAQLTRELVDFAPDFVFHLAAQPLVRLSYEMPTDTFAVNAIGTANVLEAVRQLDQPCTVVIVTTDKVYENKEWLYPYRENDALGGYDPYSASKACAELITNSYAQSFFNVAALSTHGKGIASARAGNVIGGGDWARDRIIPDIVRALRQGEPVRVRNPRAVRPWQHVLEPLHGYLQLGAYLAINPARYGGGWNFGPYAEDNKEVEGLVQAALGIWGEGNYDKPLLAGQPHEAGLLKLDISKATGELGWRPRYTADQAIAHTLEWYKAYYEQPVSIREFTIQQINTFASYDH